MTTPSGGYRAISTARPPPTLSHVGENSVPTFGHENVDLLPTPTPGSGGRARRRTRLEIYGSVPTRRTSRGVRDARERSYLYDGGPYPPVSQHEPEHRPKSSVRQSGWMTDLQWHWYQHRRDDEAVRIEQECVCTLRQADAGRHLRS